MVCQACGLTPVPWRLDFGCYSKISLMVEIFGWPVGSMSPFLKVTIPNDNCREANVLLLSNNCFFASTRIVYLNEDIYIFISNCFFHYSRFWIPELGILAPPLPSNVSPTPCKLCEELTKCGPRGSGGAKMYHWDATNSRMQNLE